MTPLMPTRGSAELTLPTDTQILITRDFVAPPPLVYRVFTEPDLIRRWWAGRRGSVTSVEVDLRVGGQWRFALDAGGTEVAFRGEYLEIVPNEKIVNTEIYESGPGATGEGPGAACAYTFEAHGDGTRFSLLTEVSDRATRDAVVASGMETGVQEGYDIAEEIAVELAKGA